MALQYNVPRWASAQWKSFTAQYPAAFGKSKIACHFGFNFYFLVFNNDKYLLMCFFTLMDSFL